MRFKLSILRREDVADCSVGKRFRFAVVDLDRAKDFPLNFVCMLPLRVSLDERKACIFSGVFGDRSLEMAKKLLVDALKVEADSDVKAEIGRRLKLLEPDSLIKKICVSCGKTFQADPKKKSKQRFCEDCIKRKFGSRQ